MSTITPDAREKLESYLCFQRDLGVELIRTPAPKTAATSPPAAAAPAAIPSGAATALLELQAEIGPDCRRCKLCRLGRNNVVFGSGNPNAELVFVGEGPGADEDAQGLPFVGRGGQLLTDMIQKGMGIAREQVYICNVVKCRPPENRTPEADEIAACSPFLARQIATVRPRLVCALGATAAQALRPYKGSLGSLRGVVHDITVGGFDTQLVVTYHPAYLLRDPSQKKEAWKDLQLVMKQLGLVVK